MRRFLARVATFLRRGRAEDELAREMAAHLAMLEEEFRRRGLSAPAARLAARREMGGVDLAMEMHRDARSFVWLEQLLQDARHAVRSLRKSPGFVALALVSLACGIGLNTAIFTLVHGILLKQLPVPDPHRIVQLQAQQPKFASTAFSYPQFAELSRQREIFADTVAFQPRPGNLADGDSRQKIPIELVTGSYFGFFGAQPALGRLLDEEDDRVESARPVCVISYAMWRSRFHADAAAVGRKIRVSDVSLEIVGVAPAGFRGANLQRENDVWLPTAMFPELSKTPRMEATVVWLRVLARLRPGISPGEAASRLEAASASIEQPLPKNRANAGSVYRMTDASRGYDGWRTQLHDPLVALMAGVTLVLVVACANLANLLLARAGERQQEYAIKLSLGVTRGRLMRQFLIETAALTFAGGALGVAVAFETTRYLLDLYNSGNKFLLLDVTPDASVLAYTAAGCMVTALVAGLYPAWRASRTDVSSRLKGGAHARRAWARHALILAQVTLAVTLLFGAALFGHSLRNLRTTNLGIDADRVLTLEVNDITPGKTSRTVVGSPVLGDILARARQIPGVEAAALLWPAPFSGWMSSTDLDVKEPDGSTRRIENVYLMFVTPGTLAALRQPLLRGRDFTSADRAGAPRVALINQALAAALWPGQDPLGKPLPGLKEPVEVVGVVGNSRFRGVRDIERPMLYRSFDQTPVAASTLAMRYRGRPADVERAARQIVAAHRSEYEAGTAVSMSDLLNGGISQDRLLAFLSSVFGLIGTGLALVGIYGLISYSVTRRTREVGIRVSIGAQRSDVLWLFARETMALVGSGVALGLPLALALSRSVKSMLYRVSPAEPRDAALTVAILALGALAASWIPGRRAIRIDPVRALRHD
jgi:predicted permease